ncbi:POT family MFS transporter [Adhaeretor mobilis]|uniref:Dipeptide and tripeptide permease A n=1 Tax=Adhaeretor mobilis TaxID=1930276 RepID=A0A517MZK4_9BACT|nr:POT family MFS transporter [Adhaeretor mobilis]QDT00284.1 Dipeptide and tripeptide permease A [Adhaeretor mobilis]
MTEAAGTVAVKSSGYLTSPPPTDKMPGGIPYIVGNEAAERFSFYGMRTILTVFMTKYLVDSSGALATMSDEDAKFWVHTFIVAGYTFPLLGAIVSDWLFGKYPTILVLSIVYCLGHLALALDETRVGLVTGLVLISLGMGAIKPCVSAHVGDQFGPGNKHLMSKVFGWFYLSINLGAFASSLLTPILLDKQQFHDTFGSFADTLTSLGVHPGPSLAFGVPGVLMALATFVFWLGRNRFVHIPPKGESFIKEAFSAESWGVLKRLTPIYICVAAFWCLFDQTASAWVLQAEDMNKNWLGTEWLPSQLQAANPLFILILVPLFSYVVYPALGNLVALTPLRKVGIGMFLTVPAFAISALIQTSIDGGGLPSIGWQVLAYAVLTAAEVMVSITCLEFSYTQAPNSLKSFIMSIFLLSVALGNEFTAVVNLFIQNEDGTLLLEGASYYWFFTAVMLVAAVAFVFVAVRYRERSYIQGEMETT